MAYKEIKLDKGAAKGLYDLWNSGMEEPKGKKEAPKKDSSKKATPAKKK